MGNTRRMRRRIERQQIAHARRERRRTLMRFGADNGLTYQEVLDLERQVQHERAEREAEGWDFKNEAGPADLHSGDVVEERIWDDQEEHEAAAAAFRRAVQS